MEITNSCVNRQQSEFRLVRCLRFDFGIKIDVNYWLILEKYVVALDFGRFLACCQVNCVGLMVILGVLQL